MKYFRLSCVVLCFVFFSIGLGAQSVHGSNFTGTGFPGQEEEWEEMEKSLSGRDFVALGEIGIVFGSLLTMDGEWFVQTADELYEIHLGDHDHRERTGIALEVGKEVVACGYLYDDDIAVVALSYADNTLNCPHTTGEIVAVGRVDIISGILTYRNGNFFVCPVAESNDIPLAGYDWLEGGDLKNWTGASVEAFLNRTGDDAGLFALSLTEGTFHFRTVEGTPLWAGQGRGESREALLFPYNGRDVQQHQQLLQRYEQQ